MIRVATLNIRNTTDRYEERKDLLGKVIVGLEPDIIGFQEVAWNQIPFLYESFGSKGMILQSQCRDPILSKKDKTYRVDGDLLLISDYTNNIKPDKISVLRTDTLILSFERVAQKAIISYKTDSGKRTFVIANTHLHNGSSREDILERERQCENMIEWIEKNNEKVDGFIVLGDFNCNPEDPTYKYMINSNYYSGYKFVCGEEPTKTFPSGIIADTMDDGPDECIDFIWIKGKLTPFFSSIWAHNCDINDKTIYPSDHFGIFVDLMIH